MTIEQYYDRNYSQILGKAYSGNDNEFLHRYNEYIIVVKDHGLHAGTIGHFYFCIAKNINDKQVLFNGNTQYYLKEFERKYDQTIECAKEIIDEASKDYESKSRKFLIFFIIRKSFSYQLNPKEIFCQYCLDIHTQQNFPPGPEFKGLRYS